MVRAEVAAAAGGRSEAPALPDEGVNELRLVGRVSGAPAWRELPSGDEVVQLRIVVPRPPRRPPRGRPRPGGKGAASGAGAGPARASVDTFDVTCWTPLTRRAAGRLVAGQVVEVRGALRRRFYRVGAGTQSRYDVEVSLLRRLR